MGFHLHRKNDLVIVELEGELVVGNREELRDLLLAQLADGAGKFVIDFQKTNFIDSSGLSVLVGLWKRIREEGGDLRLANLTEDLRDYFRLTKLDGVFWIADSREAALKDF